MKTKPSSPSLVSGTRKNFREDVVGELTRYVNPLVSRSVIFVAVLMETSRVFCVDSDCVHDDFDFELDWRQRVESIMDTQTFSLFRPMWPFSCGLRHPERVLLHALNQCPVAVRKHSFVRQVAFDGRCAATFLFQRIFPLVKFAKSIAFE